MKIYLFLLGLWISTSVVAQKPDIRIRFKQKIEQGDKLFAQNNIKGALQSYNVARVLAGADNTKQKQVDACVEKVFVAIDKQKQEAITNAKRAKFSEEIAIFETTKAQIAEAKAIVETQKAMIYASVVKRLYWSSEAGRMNPIEGIRLLEEAKEISGDTNSIKVIQEQTEDIFNNSGSHEFREKKRFTGDINSVSLFNKDIKILDNYKSVSRNISNAKIEANAPYSLQNDKVDELNEVIESTSYSNDNKWLIRIISSNTTRELHVIDRFSNKYLSIFENDTGVDSAYFSIDSNWLVTKDKNREIKVWSLLDVDLYTILKDNNSIALVTFSPDGKLLVIREKNNIRLWDITSGKRVSFLSVQKDKGYLNFPLGEAMKEYELWDVSSSKSYNTLFNEKNIVNVFFSTNSKWLVTEYTNGVYKLWDIFSGKSYDFLSSERGIYRVYFSFDSNWLVTRAIDGYSKLWDVSNGKEASFLSFEKDIRDAYFSLDSKWLVTKDEKEVYKLWDIKSGKEVLFLSYEQNVGNVSFSSDSKWLVTGYSNGVYKLWDVSSGKLYDFLSSEKGIRDIVFSSDSKWLVTIALDGGRKLWDVSSGKLYDFLSSEKGISDIEFSSDSKWLVTKDDNKVCKLWDIINGKEASFLSSEKDISKIYFSKDSKLLSITTGHKVKTYKVGDSKPIQTLWLNKEATQVDIIDNQIYVTVGKAVIKTDLEKDSGDIMSWGDGEPLTYKYDEIQEWIKVFGDKYLLPLSEEVKKKYGIK